MEAALNAPPIPAKPKVQTLTRRGFLKVGTLAGATSFLTNTLFGEWVANKNPELAKEKWLSEYRIGWDARPWVWINLSIASNLINGYEIQPGEEISLIHLLKMDQMQKVSRVNTDPNNGYIAAQVSDPNKDTYWADGLCLASTSIFRAALMAPLEITERGSHYTEYAEYFQDLPPGTDAAVYEPDAGETTPRTDLKLKNPTDRPLRLVFCIYDEDGKRIHTPEKGPSTLEYKMSYPTTIVKTLRRKFFQFTGIMMPHQYFPQYTFSNRRIIVRAGFIDDSPKPPLQYQRYITPPQAIESDTKNKTFQRKITIIQNGAPISFEESFVSQYK